MKYLIRISFLFILILSSSTYLMASCIAVVTVGGGEFWSEVKKGALTAGKELNTKIYYRSPIDATNTNGQKQIIKKAIQKGCKGFVIAPSSKEINKLTTQLKKQNIPTIYIDRDYGGDRVSVISTNNYLAGELAGTQMIKALKDKKGKVALFRLSNKVVSTSDREQGFLDITKKAGLEIVIDQSIGDRIKNTRKNSFETIKKMSNINGIFTPNETTTLGVLINLQNLNKQSNIVHIGFDSHEIFIKALKKNTMDGFIIQNPFQMGYQGVHNIYKVMQGEEIDSKIDMDVIFVNKKNINTEMIKKMLNLK